jgi:hypothetical protein
MKTNINPFYSARRNRTYACRRIERAWSDYSRAGKHQIDKAAP